MLPDTSPTLPVDFLAIGHICRDLIPGGHVVGGAAAYTAATARALGCRAAAVTSSSPDEVWAADLPGITIYNVPAPATTVFENVYTPAGRVQTIHAVAAPLTVAAVPPAFARAPIVYLGPIANEIDPQLIEVFSNSIVGIGPQGWMRRWDARGHVYQVDWDDAARTLPLAAAVFISFEDLPDRANVAEYARLAPLLVVTDGANGCSVYYRGEARHFPSPRVQDVDTTGAGDIFAAAYLVRLLQTDGNIWEAAEFANLIAAHSVTCRGLTAKMDAIRCLVADNLAAGH